jgi:hypothetical protein
MRLPIAASLSRGRGRYMLLEPYMAQQHPFRHHSREHGENDNAQISGASLFGQPSLEI